MLAVLIGLLVGPCPPLVYPLEHPPAVTSTFGTYRISHHHAGLDLVTGDDETVAVVSAAAGEVSRQEQEWLRTHLFLFCFVLFCFVGRAGQTSREGCSSLT